MKSSVLPTPCTVLVGMTKIIPMCCYETNVSGQNATILVRRSHLDVQGRTCALGYYSCDIIAGLSEWDSMLDLQSTA